MKSIKDKRQLAVSYITKQFREERKRRGLSPLNKEEKKQIKANMDEIKANEGKNVYNSKSLEQLEILKQRLLITKSIILEEIAEKKDVEHSFRLKICDIYISIVEEAIRRKLKS